MLGKERKFAKAFPNLSALPTSFEEENLDSLGILLDAAAAVHNAAEAIDIFALAMKFGLTNRDLKKVLWAYPTHITQY